MVPPYSSVDPGRDSRSKTGDTTLFRGLLSNYPLESVKSRKKIGSVNVKTDAVDAAMMVQLLRAEMMSEAQKRPARDSAKSVIDCDHAA